MTNESVLQSGRHLSQEATIYKRLYQTPGKYEVFHSGNMQQEALCLSMTIHAATTRQLEHAGFQPHAPKRKEEEGESNVRFLGKARVVNRYFLPTACVTLQATL